MMRRACCASTNRESISPAFAIAASTAFFVISLKRTRRNGFPLADGASVCWRCQEIASPSRSGSAARNTASALEAARFSSWSVFSLPWRTS
jgi:hypothetical protein